MLVSIYGGYFGAGMGIMMLAVLGSFIEGTIHEQNALKNWLGLLINFSASIVFFEKRLFWPVPAVALAAGAVLGGYGSARLSQRFDSEKLRKAIVVLGAGMTVWFAIRVNA